MYTHCVQAAESPRCCGIGHRRSNPCLYRAQWHTMENTDLGARKEKRWTFYQCLICVRHRCFISIISLNFHTFLHISNFADKKESKTQRFAQSEVSWDAKQRFALCTDSKPRILLLPHNLMSNSRLATGYVDINKSLSYCVNLGTCARTHLDLGNI